MWSAPRSLALLAVLAILLAPATAGAAVAGAPPPTGSVPDASGTAASAGSGAPAAISDPVGQPRLSRPANTTIRIDLYANATARWSVVTTYELESDEERDAFREYAEAYRNGETDAGPSADSFRYMASRASEMTGREMRIQNVTRTGTVNEKHGSVGLSFRWTAMLGRAGNGTLTLSDAVLLPGNRTWLSTIEANQRLIIATPERYSIVDSSGPSFDIRNNAIVVEGPRSLEGPLSVTYRRTGAPPTPDGGEQWPLVVGGVLLVALLLVAAYVYFRHGDDAPTPTPAASDGDGVDPAAGSPAESTLDAEGPVVDDDAAADSETAVVGGGDAGGMNGTDPELLADEERVEHLLARHDGRMKQANIVSETGWSDAKVSQLLSSMADEGRIEKLRLGRENLISLPDEDGDESG